MAASNSALQHAGRPVESSDTPARPDDFAIVDGCRVVKPYYFDFCCSVRQRWSGQSIIDIFSREFPSRDRQYYVQALKDGRLRVEGCQATAETPLKEGQCMRHFVHRHEPPVPAGSIQIVGKSADAVAVCKPHGMPVHAAGQYRKNTVLGILSAERPDLGPLLPIHRLDKPVSGVLLFARSAAAAAALGARIEGHAVDKVYVARVLGRFPASDGPIVVDVPLAWDPEANHATAEPQDTAVAALAADQGGGQGAAELAQDVQQEQQQVDEQEPLGELTVQQQRQRRKLEKQARKAAKASRKAAAAAAAAVAAQKPSKRAAKPARTEFRLLAVAGDGLTSVVECRPRTGRTHQIRVHLQHMGHPIANDAQYGGTYDGPLASRQMAAELGVNWPSPEQRRQQPGGDANGRGTQPGEAPARDAACSKRARLEADADAARVADGRARGVGSADGAAGDEYARHAAFCSLPEFQPPAELCDAACMHCPHYPPRDYPVDLRPLWLHARSYSCAEEGWSFAAEAPEWARADYVPPP